MIRELFPRTPEPEKATDLVDGNTEFDPLQETGIGYSRYTNGLHNHIVQECSDGHMSGSADIQVLLDIGETIL